MATIKVIDVIKRVEDILQDSSIRWPRIELQNWINESYLQIVLMRPDASSKANTLTCVAGTRQTLAVGFPSALRLLDVVRNLATTSDKKVIRQLSRSVLDDQRPSWHTETGTVNIQNFTFDPRQPKEFFVYPPATTATRVEVVYADSPGAHALTEAQLDPGAGTPSTVVINLDDTYLSSIIDWVLYRSYSKDAEYAANAQRATAHNGAFLVGLNSKTQSDAASVPMGTIPTGNVPTGG
jgi:hypothetical protein